MFNLSLDIPQGGACYRRDARMFHAATQLVAPSAVTIAVAILAIICTMNFNVSFLVIVFHVYLVSNLHRQHGSILEKGRVIRA